MNINFEKISPESNFIKIDDLKFVNNQYLKEKILGYEYKKTNVTKIGEVQARPLNIDECVVIYYYNHKAEIEETNHQVKTDREVLVTKTIAGREYNSIMDCISFHKHYHWNENRKAYTPVFDPFLAYEVNESICFINLFGQEVTLNAGDFICPYDTSFFQKWYSIYKYNFDDNYAFVDNESLMKANFEQIWNDTNY